MKLYGSLSRLVAVLFRKDGQDLTLRPNQGTTYTAARDHQLPPGDTAHVLVSASSTATFTNKTFDADGSGNSISNIEDADIKSGAAIDAAKIANGSVSSTEFQYLDGVTSAIQTQIDGKQPLDGDLTAVAALSSTGLAARTASNTWALRTLTAGTGISISNGDGVSGNPMISATATSSSFKTNWLTADGTSKSITHSLNSSDLIISIIDTTTKQVIEVDTMTLTDANTLDLVSSEAPGTSWRVVILAV